MCFDITLIEKRQHFAGQFFTLSNPEDVPGSDLAADQDVVVVTLAYRLNAFGFLSYEDSMIPGNAGLHDQYLAILWASQIIFICIST